MKKRLIATLVACAAAGSISGLIAGTVDAAGLKGEALFKQHCSVCHVNGGNLITPAKTLQKKDRDANNVKTSDAIVRTMRNPGPGMTKFDNKMITEKDAREIAEYIVKTFK